MIKVSFICEGKRRACTRSRFNETKENYISVIEAILTKYPGSTILANDTPMLLEAIKEKGVDYKMLNINDTAKKPVEEPKSEPKEEKINLNDLEGKDFDKVMCDLLEKVTKEQAEIRDEEVRKATIEEEKKLEKDLEILEGDVNRTFMLIGKNAVSKIVNSTPDAAYYYLIKAMNSRIKEVEELTDGEENSASAKLKKLRESIEDKAYNIEEYHNGFVNIMAKIGLFILKLGHIFLGVSKFALDVVVTSFVLLVRVGCAAGKEVVYAGKNIGRSFNKNVLRKTNAFNVDKYVDNEEIIKGAITKHQEQLIRLKAKLAELEKDNK